MQAKLGKDLVGALDKRDPRLHKIEQAIIAQYEQGRVSSMSDEEMARCVREYFPDLWTPEARRRLAIKGVRVEEQEPSTR